MRPLPILTALLLAALLMVAVPTRAADRAAWTLLFYLDANNDLEAAEMQDLEEMLAVGSTDEVSIVVLAARSPNDDEEDGYTAEGVANLEDWTTAKLLVVEKGALSELADWGTVNMASGKTLARFLKETIPQFPAERYALVLGDHGASWPGCCGDESEGNEGDMLTLNELSATLKQEIEPTIGRLELIGFDACLMANFETAVAVAPYARYMVASEELEPGTGWSYTPTLGRLVRNPKADGAAFGRNIVDDFIDSFEQSSDEDMRDAGIGTTLSVTDLSRVSALADAVDRLAAACGGALQSGGNTSWIQVAGARSRSEEYGKSEDRDDDSSHVFDLGDFAAHVARQVPGAKQAAAEVQAAVKTAVVYTRSGKGRPRATGLSIFIPKRQAQLTDPASYADLAMVRGTDWLAFVERFVGVTSSHTERPQVAPVQSSAATLTEGEKVVVGTTVQADDIEECFFVLGEVDQGKIILIGSMASSPDDAGALSEEWDGSWFSIGSGEVEMICPITAMEEVEDEDDTWLVQVPVERKRGNAWQELTLHFYVRFLDQGGADGRFVYAFTETRFGPKEVYLRKGDVLRPVYVEIDEEGNDALVASDDPGDHLVIADADDLRVDYVAVPDGKYLIGFVVTDYAGNTTEETTEIEINMGEEAAKRKAIGRK